MKTYNQFDASIKMLSKYIPIFLRNAYGAFVKTEGEALTAILKINEKSPYTAKKIIDDMFGDTFYADVLSTKTNGHVNTGDVLGAFKLTHSTCENAALMKYLAEKCTVKADFDELHSIEEPCPDSPDIYAPLKQIRGVLTNIENRFDDIPVVSFQFYEPYFNEWDPHRSYDDVDNMLGFRTVLDFLSAECTVDLFDLFRIFYKKALTLAPTDNICVEPDEAKKDSIAIMRLEAIHNIINDNDFSTKILAIVEKDVMRTAISTYLTFAGKLRGVKSDLVGWLYTFFVKDSMRDLERGDHPTASDITDAARMTTGNDDGDAPRNSTNRAKYVEELFKLKMCNGEDTGVKPEIFYKELKLLYSNWAAVINTIIKIDRNDRGDFHTWNAEDANIVGGIDNDGQRDTAMKSHVDLAKVILTSYLIARFRTFNLPFQNLVEKAGQTPSDKLMKNGINAIVDLYNKEVIKDFCQNVEKKKHYFVQYDKRIEYALNDMREAIGTLADEFMMTSYLIMLDYIHTHQEAVISQDDPNTGKEAREQFEEIYTNLKNNLYSTIFRANVEPRLLDFTKSRLVADTVAAANDGAVPFDDPVFVNIQNRSNMKSKLYHSFDDDDSDTTIMDKEIAAYLPETDYELKKLECENAFMGSYIISCVTDMMRPKMHYTGHEQPYWTASSPAYRTRANSIFPKNQLIIDQIAKMRLNTANVFASVESAPIDAEKLNKACDAIESKESEWAHMSCNDIACIGGQVCDLEITNEAAPKEPGTETTGTEPAPLSVDDIQTVSENPSYNASDIALNDGNVAENKPKDSEDIKALSAENLKAIERYNHLFNKVVFGCK